MNKYVHTVTTKGKTYNYFRPGGSLKRNRFPQVRLSDDPAEAAAQAAVLAELRPEAPLGQLHDALARTMAETRRRAKRRGLPFTITEAQAKAILKLQGETCAITGLEFDLTYRGEGDLAFRRPFAPSLDRIDCAGGYVASNVRIVCCAVNVALNEWGLETFLKVARAAIEKHETGTRMENAADLMGKRVVSGEPENHHQTLVG